MNTRYLEEKFRIIRKTLLEIHEDAETIDPATGESSLDAYVVNTFENIFDELTSLEVYLGAEKDDEVSILLQTVSEYGSK